MNRLEAAQFLLSFLRELSPPEAAKTSPAIALKPFLDLVLSLKKELPVSIPLLRDLAEISGSGKTGSERWKGKAEGLLKRRIERRYLRLCRNQEELGRLNLKKALPGTSPEDYIFSQINFTRYREIDEKTFDILFPEGLEDFDENFFGENFGIGRAEIKSTVEGSYTRMEGFYRIRRETPLVISIMRTLETSLDNLDIFSAGEIGEEIKNLLVYTSENERGKLPHGAERLFPLLVQNLDNTFYTHEDGMKTRFFFSPNGDLSGTFLPGNKPWTVVLIRHSVTDV